MTWETGISYNLAVDNVANLVENLFGHYEYIVLIGLCISFRRRSNRWRRVGEMAIVGYFDLSSDDTRPCWVSVWRA
jgi:hypothetical protein